MNPTVRTQETLKKIRGSLALGLASAAEEQGPRQIVTIEQGVIIFRESYYLGSILSILYFGSLIIKTPKWNQ